MARSPWERGSTTPPPKGRAVSGSVVALTACSMEGQARRSFSTSLASDVRKQDAAAWVSGFPNLAGAPQHGSTLHQRMPSRPPSYATRTSTLLQTNGFPSGSSALRTACSTESLMPPKTRARKCHQTPNRRHQQNSDLSLPQTSDRAGRSSNTPPLRKALRVPRPCPQVLPDHHPVARLSFELDGSDDRYVRATPPSKETFLLATTKTIVSADPFAPAVRRSARMAEQLTTLRSTSRPTVWSVGGSAVTEGVASTSNGRGGRVTSGSNAPHYAAEFLQRQAQTDETMTHGRRLAHAMNISQSGRVVEQTSPPSSPISPSSSTLSSPTSVSWKDCKWERPLDASPTKVKPTPPRKIPTIPYRVLDAPALRDDYYCSLLAYSTTLQCLAVGLGPHVYLWSEDRATSQHKIPDSLTAPRGSSHVTSLSFSSAAGASAILAIGRGDGRITLWSPLDSEPRFDSEQPAPISYVCFCPTTQRRCSVRDPNTFVNTEQLLVGDEVGNVYLYSVEWPGQDQRDLFNWHGSMTLLARMTCHTQQICGIAWSPDGKLFATGGNDNNLFLFETKKVLRSHHPHSRADSPAVHLQNDSSMTDMADQDEIFDITLGRQKHTFSLNAACKAITFAPWQPSLIAAGGGSNDRCIHFFHALSGAKLATIDCYAQVTSLVFNPRKREIAATFGFAQPEHPYRVAVFAWPSCRMVVGIPWWGEERALYAIEYPGLGGSLVIATSDASIKFHEVWSGSTSDGGKGGGNVLGSPILDDELLLERIDAIR
jgi:meiosis-specific APC/C activator protein AMA1